MEFLGILALLLVVGILVGVVFGWIAFFRGLRVSRELAALKAEVARLRGALDPQARTSAASSTAARDIAAPFEPRPADAAPSSLPPPQVQTRPTATTPPPADEPAPNTAAQQPSAARPPRPKAESIFARIERSLGGNWLVYIAGGLLAVGGLFLAHVAIQSGLFGPAAQVSTAGLAGLAMIAASEWLRRRGFAQRVTLEGVLAHSAAPAVTAGAGVVTVYGAVYAAFGVYDLIPAPIAFALLAATAAGAVALALLHGPALVGLGLVGAFVAPLLIGSDDPNAGVLFLYVFAVAGVGLAVTRLVGRRWPALIALAGGTIWPLLWLWFGYRDDQAWALALYLPALFAAAIAFAWDQAEHPPALTTWKGLLATAPVSVATAYLSAIAVFLLSLGLLDATRHGDLSVLSIGASALLAMGAAWRREALFAAPIIAAAGVSAALYTWSGATPGSPVSGLGTETSPFVAAAMAFAVLFGVGGVIAKDRLRLKGAMAGVAAGAPVLILAIAYWRIAGLELGSLGEGLIRGVDHDARWAAAAIALAGANIFLLERLSRAGVLEDQPGPGSAYALGASAAAALAVGVALDQLWMSVGFGVLVPVAALLYRRFRVPPLAWAAVAFGVIATARLTVLGGVFDYDVGSVPILNWLLFGYGVPIAAMWAGMIILRVHGLPRTCRTVQAIEAEALLLMVAFASMQIRHLVNGGDLGDAYFDRGGLLEAGLHSSAWLAGALLLRWRLGPKLYFVQRWAERLLITAGLLQTVFLQLLMLNPWIEAADAWPIEGPFLVNELLIAYGLPGALAAAYAIVARRQGMRRIGTVAGLIGAALLFIWVTFETRHVFHPIWLYDGPATDGERYAYSAVWLVFAVITLALGALRRRPSMRYVAQVLLVLVTLKAFLFDMEGLEGVLRALSFIGLGAALMGIGLFYQRILPRLIDAAPPDTSEASA